MFSRYFDVFLDSSRGPAAPLLAGATSTSTAAAVVWILRDDFTLRVRILKRGSTELTSLTAIAIEAGDTILVGGRAANDPDADGFLFSAVDFTEIHEGADAEDGYRYEAALDLNTVPLIAAVTATTDGRLAVVVTVQIRNAANTSRLSFQFPATIRSGVTGGEGAPVAGDPPYPPPGDVLTLAQIGSPQGVPAGQTLVIPDGRDLIVLRGFDVAGTLTFAGTGRLVVL